MDINERVAQLEQGYIELKARVDMLSRMEHYVTPADLAKILHCSKKPYLHPDQIRCNTGGYGWCSDPHSHVPI